MMYSDWIDVKELSTFPSGERTVIDLEDTRVIVFNLDGDIFAIEDACSHDSGELSSGKLEGDEIICPRHGARFCIRNGHVTKPPAFEDIATFPVRVEHGVIQIRDHRWD